MGEEGREIDQDLLRDEVIAQLRESLEKSREMMFNLKLDAKARERWAQIHTNTAQVLNQVLRDRQSRDWEKRLRQLEAEGRIPRRTILGTRLYVPMEKLGKTVWTILPRAGSKPSRGRRHR